MLGRNLVSFNRKLPRPMYIESYNNTHTNKYLALPSRMGL